MNDHELLRDYVNTGPQTAFTQLVERYLPLVYSAALRSVSDSHFAQDIAQQVFTLLARKAVRLTPNIVLPGWLYRTTTHLAARTLRGDLRRRHREQLAVEAMNQTHTDETWRQIESLLDEAMAYLGERDRDAVVLRYFENKSLKEVGDVLGTNDDAAQKRLARAVEKLRAFFAKHGKVVTTSSLGIAITGGAIQPAPASLAATISAVALSGAATTVTLTSLKLMSWSTLKPIVATGAAIAAAVTISIQSNHSTRLGRENETLHAQIQQKDAASAELKTQVNALTLQRQNDPRQSELLRLRSEVTRLHDLERELNQLRAQSAQREQNPKGQALPEAGTTPQADSNQQDPVLLFTRVYKVNPETLKAYLRTLAGGTNATAGLQEQMLDYFRSSGVDLQPPVNVSFNEDKGMLMVRATLAYLDAVENAIQPLSEKATKP